MINDYGVKCLVLTKGLPVKELAACDKRNTYGITLVSLEEKFRETMEPNSAPYRERIESLKNLKRKGYTTWVSIEPYPTPNIIDQNLEAILNELSFVDRIIFGRLNYNKLVSTYKGAKTFFNEAAEQVIEFCDKKRIAYHIKEGTISECTPEAVEFAIPDSSLSSQIASSL